MPFAAVHLLFINLLTDSLPAIALGLEPHTDEVMQEKPRPRNEGILTRPFLTSVAIEGLVIAVATIAGLPYGSANRRRCRRKHHGLCDAVPEPPVPRLQLQSPTARCS